MRFKTAIVCIITLISFTFSCSDDDDDLPIISACGVDNPVRDLPFLRTEIAEREQNPTQDTQFCFITQGTLNGETVFVYQDCNPSINKIIPIFDCEGILLNGLDNSIISIGEVTDQVIIWQPNDFVCQVSF